MRPDITFALLLTMKAGTVPSLDPNGSAEASSDSRQFRDGGRQVSMTLSLGYWGFTEGRKPSAESYWFGTVGLGAGDATKNIFGQ